MLLGLASDPPCLAGALAQTEDVSSTAVHNSTITCPKRASYIPLPFSADCRVPQYCLCELRKVSNHGNDSPHAPAHTMTKHMIPPSHDRKVLHCMTRTAYLWVLHLTESANVFQLFATSSRALSSLTVNYPLPSSRHLIPNSHVAICIVRYGSDHQPAPPPRSFIPGSLGCMLNCLSQVVNCLETFLATSPCSVGSVLTSLLRLQLPCLCCALL